MLEITSLQNPKIKHAIQLTERKERNVSGLFLIEGYRELLRACHGNVRIQTLFICPSLFLGSNEKVLIEDIRTTNVEIILCSEKVFYKLSYRDRPDGLIAIAHQMRKTLSDVTIQQNPFLIIAEAIEKPGNLGTILRSADAAGADAVIVCDPCTDIYNPNVVRASVGTLFTLPVVEERSAAILHYLKQNQIQIVAATPSAQKEFTEANLTGPIAIAVGTEQLGLSALWMQSADIQVRIPMHGVADSLNVSAATTLLLYEVVRQRNNADSLRR